MALFGFNKEEILDVYVVPTDPHRANILTIFNHTLNTADAIPGSDGLLSETDAKRLAGKLMEQMALPSRTKPLAANHTVDLSAIIPSPAEVHFGLPPRPFSAPFNVTLEDAASYLVWETAGEKMDNAVRQGLNSAAANARKFGYNYFGADLATTYATAVSSGNIQKKAEQAIKLAAQVEHYKTESVKWAKAFTDPANASSLTTLDADIINAVTALAKAMQQRKRWRDSVSATNSNGDSGREKLSNEAIAEAERTYQVVVGRAGSNSDLQEAVRQRFHVKAMAAGVNLANVTTTLPKEEDRAAFGSLDDSNSLRTMMEKTIIERSLNLTNDPALGLTIGKPADKDKAKNKKTMNIGAGVAGALGVTLMALGAMDNQTQANAKTGEQEKVSIFKKPKFWIGAAISLIAAVAALKINGKLDGKKAQNALGLVTGHGRGASL